jgi:hypothetical protein
MIKEKGVGYFEVLLQHLPGGSEENHDRSLRCEVLMVKMLMVVFWAVMSCGLTGRWLPMFRRNVGNYL